MTDPYRFPLGTMNFVFTVYVRVGIPHQHRLIISSDQFNVNRKIKLRHIVQMRNLDFVQYKHPIKKEEYLSLEVLLPTAHGLQGSVLSQHLAELHAALVADGLPPGLDEHGSNADGYVGGHEEGESEGEQHLLPAGAVDVPPLGDGGDQPQDEYGEEETAEHMQDRQP